MNGWSWLMLHNFLNLNNQQLASVCSRPGTSSSQLRFTAWLQLGISKPSTSSSHLSLLYSSGRVPCAKHRRGLTLACTTQETPGPMHPVYNYGPHHHIEVPPPCPCTADPLRRAEISGQWSEPVLAADWPEKIPPIDLPTETKAQLQKKRVLSLHEGCTLSTQLGR